MYTAQGCTLPSRAISSASTTGHPKSLNILETVLLPVAIPPVKPTINMAVDGQWFRSFCKIYPTDISAILEVNELGRHWALPCTVSPPSRCTGIPSKSYTKCLPLIPLEVSSIEDSMWRLCKLLISKLVPNRGWKSSPTASCTNKEPGRVISMWHVTCVTEKGVQHHDHAAIFGGRFLLNCVAMRLQPG